MTILTFLDTADSLDLPAAVAAPDEEEAAALPFAPFGTADDEEV